MVASFVGSTGASSAVGGASVTAAAGSSVVAASPLAAAAGVSASPSAEIANMRRELSAGMQEILLTLIRLLNGLICRSSELVVGMLLHLRVPCAARHACMRGAALMHMTCRTSLMRRANRPARDVCMAWPVCRMLLIAEGQPAARQKQQLMIR